MSLITYKDLNNLIENGDCEDLYLECKDQVNPSRISRDVLAKSISGFSNTSGGVFIWGAQTDKKNGEDVITQLLPIGNIDSFKKRIANAIPTLTTPSVTDFELKIIKRNNNDTKGFLVGFLPARQYAPTQSIIDNRFYLRSGAQFTIAPYEFIHRMFAAQDTPDVRAQIRSSLLKYDKKNDRFIIPICVANESVSVGREILISVEVLDFNTLKSVTADGGLKDISDLNKGRKLYSAHMEEVLHKGFPTIMGNIYIGRNRKKVANITVSVFADKMQTVRYKFKVRLHIKKPQFSLEQVYPEY